MRKGEATVRHWEMLWNWVAHDEPVRVDMSPIMEFTLFSWGENVIFYNSAGYYSSFEIVACVFCTSTVRRL